MNSFFKKHRFSILLMLALAALYWAFAYNLMRSDSLKLISLYSALFVLSFKLIGIEKRNFWILAGAAFCFRLIFIGALPRLSQDFYRFIWDGRLIAEGINPYLFTPQALLKTPNFSLPQATVLLAGMGKLSASNYTSYPPLNQFFFWIAGTLSQKSILGPVISLRSITILADFGTLYFGKKLLEQLQLPPQRIFWYILNPFLIIECTGNLHFEAVMIFFLIFSIYLLQKRKWVASALMFSLSVSVKLLPLLFLPLLLKFFLQPDRHFFENLKIIGLPEYKKPKLVKNEGLLKNLFSNGLEKLLAYYTLVLLGFAFSFVPFLSIQLSSHFIESIALWFQKFEFNASFYYVVRWLGFRLRGYNIIAAYGQVMPILLILGLALLSVIRPNQSLKSLFASMLFSISAYFFLATTVHPWYLAMPLILSIFTRYRFVLVWVFIAFVSYFAYRENGVQENLWWMALEYTTVIAVFLWELKARKPAFSGFFKF